MIVCICAFDRNQIAILATLFTREHSLFFTLLKLIALLHFNLKPFAHRTKMFTNVFLLLLFSLFFSRSVSRCCCCCCFSARKKIVEEILLDFFFFARRLVPLELSHGNSLTIKLRFEIWKWKTFCLARAQLSHTSHLFLSPLAVTLFFSRF